MRDSEENAKVKIAIMKNRVFKTSRINLHIEVKRVLLMIALFSLLSVIIDSIILISANDTLIKLKSLCSSKYSYSACSRKPIGKDEYLTYDASISFSILSASDICLNANVVMQSDTALYSHIISWQADELDAEDIAITEGLAIRNNIKLGSRLYSKHNVDGRIHEYTVKQILPDAIDVRISKKNSFSSGIIIMGYDLQYAENLSYEFLVFSNENVDTLYKTSEESLTDILYREDEIKSVVGQYTPYLTVVIASSILILIILATVVTKEVSYNFKRLVMLGYSRKDLDKTYKKNLYGICGVVVFISTAITSIILCFMSVCPYSAILLGMIAAFDGLVICIVEWIQRNRLWRQ